MDTKSNGGVKYNYHWMNYERKMKPSTRKSVESHLPAPSLSQYMEKFTGRKKRVKGFSSSLSREIALFHNRAIGSHDV